MLHMKCFSTLLKYNAIPGNAKMCTYCRLPLLLVAHCSLFIVLRIIFTVYTTTWYTDSTV